MLFYLFIHSIYLYLLKYEKNSHLSCICKLQLNQQQQPTKKKHTQKWSISRI